MRMGMFAWAFGKANACAWACLLGHLERRMHAHGHVCSGKGRFSVMHEHVCKQSVASF